MNTQTFVALFCLASVWVMALLVAATAVHRALELLRLSSTLKENTREATVVEGAGPDGALGALEVVRAGRALDAKVPTLAWHPRKVSAPSYGGVVESGGLRIQIPSNAGRVWVSDAVLQSALERPAHEDWAQTLAQASTQAAAERTVRAPIRVGDKVFVAGKTVTSGNESRLSPLEGGELVVSHEPPAAWLSKRALWGFGFSVLELLVCAALSALALWTPAYGTVSMVGAVGLVAFFLAVTPLGVSLTEAMRLPDERLPRGFWKAP